MNHRTALLGAAALLALAACSDDKEAPALNCADPAVTQSVQQQLQQAISQSARQFAQTDSRQFVDADKIIAAASQLTVSLADAQTDSSSGKPICNARLNVAVTPAIWQQAEANTPILYPQQQLQQLLKNQITGSQIQIDAASFSQPLRYTPAPQTASAPGNTLSIEAPGLAQLSHVLTNALLPYGIKDTLMINGQPYSRADALKILSTPNAQIPGAQNADAAMASALLNGTPLPGPQAASATAQAAELQQAQSNNRNANNAINDVWRNMDDIVRDELQNEQRQWISQKSSQCHQAAGAGVNAQQAEYLRLQCDTRITNERIDYLNGFSTPQ